MSPAPAGERAASPRDEAASLTAAALAQLVSGRLEGDGSVRLRRVAPLDRAQGDELTFLGAAKYAPMMARSQAGAVLVAPALAASASHAPARIVVDDPYEAMLRALPALYPRRARQAEIHPTAVIAPGALLGRDVAIGPYVVIGAGAALGDRVTVEAHSVIGEAAHVGDDSWLAPSVTVYPNARIGKRVRLHSGVRIGTDGFGYVFRDGAHEKMPHVGGCVIEDDVEIGANSTIDRGSIDDTVIGAGTKIDNLVHIAHNVRVGRLCLLMAQVGVAGSVQLGDGCILAGQVGVSGHHTIGAGVRLGAQAGVFGDIPAGETWSGYPARPHKEALRASAALFKLSGMMRRLEQLLDGRER